MSVSVCIATYNGEKYIAQQLISIFDQIEGDDEIIIVDDNSQDNTLSVINSFIDPRIKIFKNTINRGHVFSFAKALSLASKNIIFLSDQDDIWIKGRLDFMRKKLLQTSIKLISTNTIFIDSNNSEIIHFVDGVESKFSNYYLKNIFDIFKGKKNYFGCAMALKAELLSVVLPIPKYVESHDLWIAMAGNLIKSNLHCDEITLKRRIHGSNSSVIQRKLYLKLISRFIFLISFFHLLYRINFKKHD